MRAGGLIVSGCGLAVVLIVMLLPMGSLEEASAQGSHNVTKEMVDNWMEELSNWGRWGKDDELGTMNLITPQKRRAAAKLVRSGRVRVSLAQREQGQDPG